MERALTFRSVLTALRRKLPALILLAILAAAPASATITNTASVTTAQGNGATTIFTYNFLIPDTSSIVVVFTDASGNKTTIPPTQFSVTGLGLQTGGTVTYPVMGAPIASGTALTISRIVPYTQARAISNQGAFYPQVVESALDTLTMQTQQLAAAVAGSSPAGLPSVPVFVGGTSTGSANTQALAAVTPSNFAFTSGNKVVFLAGFTNTGPLTLNVAGSGAIAVAKRTPAGLVPLAGSEIQHNSIVEVNFDGTLYELISPVYQSAGPQVSLVSGFTTDLGSAISNNVLITGTNTITSLGSSAVTSFPIFYVTFQGPLTLTFNATSLILPGLANIQTAANDTAIFAYLGNGNWQCLFYTSAAAGPVVQTVPSGTVMPFSGLSAPTGFLFANGQSITSGSNPTLFNALAIATTGNEHTSTTIDSIPSTANMVVGMSICGVNIPAATVITSIAANSVTLSQATTNTASGIAIAVAGYGCTSATQINVPDLRGRSWFGSDTMGTTAANRLQVAVNITTTNGSVAATVASATGVAAGMTVSATSVPIGTKISAINGTSVTLSSNATATGTNASRLSLIGDAQLVGQSGGAPTHTQIANELVAHNHSAAGLTGSFSATNSVSAFSGGSPTSAGEFTGDVNGLGSGAVTSYTPTGSVSIGGNTASTGNGAAMATQPTGLIGNWIVKTSGQRMIPANDGWPRAKAA